MDTVGVIQNGARELQTKQLFFFVVVVVEVVIVVVVVILALLKLSVPNTKKYMYIYMFSSQYSVLTNIGIYKIGPKNYE